MTAQGIETRSAIDAKRRGPKKISPIIEREDRGDGEERYIVKGVPCGFPVAKFGDCNDAELFVFAATKLRAALASMPTVVTGELQPQGVGASVPDEWRPVPGFELIYMISRNGRIRNCSTGKLLFGERDRDGYRLVNLTTAAGKKCKRRVHRLVCEAFHGPGPPGSDVAHGDGNPGNNAADNLRWASRSENMLDAARHGTLVNPRNPGELHPNAKLTAANVAAIRASSESHRAIARSLGVSDGTIRKIRKGDRWQTT